jgi:hypothetical protein
MNVIPGLAKDEFGFGGEIQLDAWRDFRNVEGGHGLGRAQSDGTCWLTTGGDAANENAEIRDYHVKAYTFLMNHQNRIRDCILEQLMELYENLQTEYGYRDQEKQECMPDVSRRDDFKRLIGLSSVHLVNVEKDGVGYVGYEFGCSWDPERGLGVMTYNDEIIQIGGADVAFLSWVAKKDANPISQTTALAEDAPRAYRLTDDNLDAHNAKPWWKFWR